MISLFGTKVRHRLDGTDPPFYHPHAAEMSIYGSNFEDFGEPIFVRFSCRNEASNETVSEVEVVGKFISPTLISSPIPQNLGHIGVVHVNVALMDMVYLKKEEELQWVFLLLASHPVPTLLRETT